jgi:hypothetical protein
MLPVYRPWQMGKKNYIKDGPVMRGMPFYTFLLFALCNNDLFAISFA